MLTSGSLFDEAIFIGNELYSERRPAYVFQPNTVADIASALTMAKTRDLPFSIKCGGHSYAGYCLNDGGLMLDLSLMQAIEIDEASMTVRADCGVRWLSVYEALAKVNPGYIVTGGICPGWASAVRCSAAASISCHGPSGWPSIRFRLSP